jgi:hypothetical protein
MNQAVLVSRKQKVSSVSGKRPQAIFASPA